jgi:HD superfamily phosphohydrolase
MVNRLEFYDPLYETITFERGLPTNRGFLRTKEEPLHPVEIIQTADFARLAFLRQAGLAWLVFPSATHTRFAHSIGCWWLGRIAESLIKVRGSLSLTNGVRSLQSWLMETTLREEFYLGLLFHDVGHGPLSHVLERNRDFSQGLKGAGLTEKEVGHEHRGAALLEGTGPLASAWRDLAVRRYGNDTAILSDVFDRLENSKDVCLPAVLYFITSDERYLVNCCHQHREFLGVVHELVSGLLDLDRLDHYARDSYFSGLRQVSINVRGFLNNLCITYSDDDTRLINLCLTRDGASHAASLLFGKRQILSSMFRNPRTVALHAMSNWALSAHIKDMSPDSRSTCCLEIAMMEDDQFMSMISSSLHGGCRYVAQRIRSFRPYEYVGKWSNEFGVKIDALKAQLERIADSSGTDRSPSVILHFDDGFWYPGRQPEPRDWLDSGCLTLEDSEKCLTDHPDYADSFSHLQRSGKSKYMWAFCRTGEEVAQVRRSIASAFGYDGSGVA